WLSAISWLSVIRYPLSAIRHPVSVSDESIRHDEDPPSPMEGETLSVDALAARSRGPRRRPRAPDGGCKRGAPGESVNGADGRGSAGVAGEGFGRIADPVPKVVDGLGEGEEAAGGRGDGARIVAAGGAEGEPDPIEH